MRRLVYLAVILITQSLTTGWAQQATTNPVPPLIRFGGTLKEAAGRPIALATMGVTFTIYKQQEGGAPVWMETQNVVTDADGRYTVMLGSASSAGIPAETFTDKEERWLGVQVQGQAEQPRILLVSVPYAFKAGEAERLAGHSASEFVTTDNLQTAVQQVVQQHTPLATAMGDATTGSQGADSGARFGPDNVPTDPATNFVDSTSNQVVLVQQNGTGVALNASAPSNTAIVGTTSASGSAGVEGTSNAAGGIGIYGYAGSTTGGSFGIEGGAASNQGIAIYARESSPTGATIGLQARVDSGSGVAGQFVNTMGGDLIHAYTTDMNHPKFAVDGAGNVTSTGSVSATRFNGSGASLTGLQFSQLVDQLSNSQLSGTYTSRVTLGNSSNVYYGDGSHLMGLQVQVGPGSPYYIQNGTTQQGSASFNISGNGTLGGTLSATTLNATNPFEIGGNSVLSTSGTDNLFVGVNAGHGNSSGAHETFAGYKSGYANTTGSDNSLFGYLAGSSNTSGHNNVFVGASTGTHNTTGSNDIYVGNQGPTSGTESNAIRVGDPTIQTRAYLAGIYNASANGGVPVFINSNGQLGTSGSGTGWVSSFNGRGGAVVPQTGDYSFSMIGGTLGGAQLGGTYSNAVTLSNASNVFYGNGSNLTGITVGQGSPFYIQNGMSQQGSANFNISGNGTLGGTLSAKTVNTTNPFEIGGSSVLSAAGTDNTFVGIGAGNSNGSGTDNTFAGYRAGFSNSNGQWNSFYGSSAGRLNADGSKNTFNGYAAGYTNNSGSNNVAVGYKAGYSSTTASNNTFLGYATGNSNTTGHNNLFVGYSAGIHNTTGSNDIYMSNQGPSSGTESKVIRIGDPAVQTSAYIAGIYGNAPDGGLPVVINSSGELGSAQGQWVTSWNGRTGPVSPQSGDYSFSKITGTLADAQLSGSYSSAVSLSNLSNNFTGTFSGNGSSLTGVFPASGSPYYIQNSAGEHNRHPPQGNASFDIDGNGNIGGTLTANFADFNNLYAAGDVNIGVVVTAQYGVISSSTSGGYLISQNDGTTQSLQLQNFASPIGGYTEAQFDTNGSATFFTDAFGDTTATGTKSAAVPLANGKMVKVFSMESPEVWFEDFGSGQLTGGTTTITFDASFAQTVNIPAGYHVFLTPKGDCRGLYVTNETNDNFEVSELSGGQSNVAFDYRIVAHRKGFEEMRLPLAEMPKPIATVHPAPQKR